ncbi:MAG: hypothetical protein NC132_06825, partial [Corallococcus sp.]|nr:hypothetical protein [Corallococcus sp.]
ALYGIFATEGQLSATETLTPFVTVKDGYITEAGFYFYMGSLYGVIEITYSDFDKAVLPEGITINPETRNAPTSWDQLTIFVSGDSASTQDDEPINALEHLKTFFGDQEIGTKLPFFGNVLGDTYGFGLTTLYTPTGERNPKSAIVFYYDVPLDIDYTIESSMKALKAYLRDLGFTRNQYDEYTKNGICIAPVDASLDFTIYVWKAN